MPNRLLILILLALACFLPSCPNDKSGEESCGYDLQYDFGSVGANYFDHTPTWTASGDTMAFIRRDYIHDIWGVYLANGDGSNRTRLNCFSLFDAAISPDGQWILFSDYEIYKMNIAGDSIVQVSPGPTDYLPRWSPDGQWIAFHRESEGGLWIVKSDGTQLQKLVGGGISTLSWLPASNDEIAYFKNGDSLYVYSIASDSSRFVTYVNSFCSDIDISPDGRIIFHKSSIYDIWIMNSDGSDLHSLNLSNAIKPDWSPDGQWIVYTELKDGGRLWRIKPDGTSKKQITFAD